MGARYPGASLGPAVNFGKPNAHLNMQSRTPNDDEVPVDFPRTGDDPSQTILCWQEWVHAAGHISSMCFDAKANAASGSNNELLARTVSLVCGHNITDQETRWIVRYSAAQLGW
jgi:hypothetical protein